MRLMESAPTGPACKFGDAHIYYTLHILDRDGETSRGDLSEMMRIGEGSIRSILSLLREWDLIEVRQTGITVSARGHEFLDSLPIRLVDVPHSDYLSGTYQQGLVVSGSAGKVTDGMYQRDSAVIAGANGAIVLVVRDGVLTASGDWNMDVRDPAYSSAIRSVTGMRDGDSVIVTGASDPDMAAISAIAAGLDMV